MLQEKSFVSVKELSAEFNVSDVTIRKMLNQLAKSGYLKRTRGGAASLTASIREFEEKEKEKRNTEEKKAIAKMAYDHIEDGETIFLDAGSTTLQLARLIREGNKRNIVVVTNAINIAVELIEAEDIELILIGGNVRHRILSCVGGIAEKAIEGLFFDKLFVGTNSLDLEHGITTPNTYEAQVKQCMLKSAKERVLLVDYSKFGTVSLTKVAPVTGVDLIITDWNIDHMYVHHLRELGIEVIVADPVT